MGSAPPLPISFRLDSTCLMRTERVQSPLHMFLTCFSLFLLLSTQTRQEGVSPFSVCFYLPRHHEKGYPPSRRVFIHPDAIRRDTPLLVVFFLFFPYFLTTQ